MSMRIGAALTTLLAFGAAVAGDTSGGLQNKPEFEAMRAQMTADLQSGKQYKEITPEDQKVLLATLQRMEDHWSKVDDIAQLTPERRVEMSNDQNLVVTITTHAAKDSRVVCERIEPTNSHLPTKLCRTVAQIRRETENAQGNMRKDYLRKGDAGSH